MTDRDRLGSNRDERGAILILALFFLVSVGMTIIAILGLVGSNLLATRGLQIQRNVQYGADAAVEGAIQAVRYSPLQSPCPNYPTTGSIAIPPTTVPGGGAANQYVVVCSMAAPIGFNGRLVEFDACLATYGSSFSTCQASDVIRAEVVFTDVAVGCVVSCPPDYGAAVTITSWQVRSASA
jgi:hypothetical protein